MACQLKIGLNDGASPTNNFTGKRRKRSTESNTKSVVETKSIYGCPPDFEKVSEYLCLHLSQNTAGHARKQTFLQSKSYCATKGNGANVAFIANEGDAMALWKWMSNQFLPPKNKHMKLIIILFIRIYLCE